MYGSRSIFMFFVTSYLQMILTYSYEFFASVNTTNKDISTAGIGLDNNYSHRVMMKSKTFNIIWKFIGSNTLWFILCNNFFYQIILLYSLLRSFLYGTVLWHSIPQDSIKEIFDCLPSENSLIVQIADKFGAGIWFELMWVPLFRFHLFSSFSSSILFETSASILLQIMWFKVPEYMEEVVGLWLFTMIQAILLKMDGDSFSQSLFVINIDGR